MAGFITKKHLWQIARVYGFRVAYRAARSNQPTFLGFLISEGIA